ncbi:helix-turn-helix transcriptional regulator [Clostridium sp. 1001275B_160808_H3]|uniref:helix-turn-helix domain-containing protein n=1 Tax=Clostridium sp. 1001275B_160808_H3 TaxID=2787110 RepID=UPI00189953A6|nr:helix-turn-helix transcriptional regulator [Clostridium sp. 1001275B_160808_H3]
MEISIIGKNIKKFRENKGWSLTKLKNESGVGYATLHDIENGKTQNLNSKNLEKIASALDKTPDELLGILDYEVIEVEVGDLVSSINAIFESDELELDGVLLSDFDKKFLLDNFMNNINSLRNIRNYNITKERNDSK